MYSAVKAVNHLVISVRPAFDLLVLHAPLIIDLPIVLVWMKGLGEALLEPLPRAWHRKISVVDLGCPGEKHDTTIAKKSVQKHLTGVIITLDLQANF